MKKKKLYFFLSILTILIASYFFAIFFKKIIPQQKKIETISTISKEEYKEKPAEITIAAANKTTASALENEKAKEVTPTVITKKIAQTVPFIIQAPFGNWKDSNFQNGCEEASIIMAMGWVNEEKSISQDEAQERILAIIDFENKTLGYSTDTNAFDVEKIFKQYFKYEKVKAQEEITLNDIKTEIQKGNLAVIPAFGQALKNPNFTAPGPVAHMLVIIGYDPKTKQFITNDPGTRNGAGYQYDENILFDAIWEYPSGKTDPPMPTSGKMKKAMIVVSK